MRRLLYISLGFGTACAVQAYTVEGLPRLLCLVAVLVFSALAGPNPRPLHRAGLTLLGLLLGFGWFCRFEAACLTPVRDLNGMTCAAEIRVSDYPEETDYGFAVEGTMAWKEKSYRLRLYLNEQLDAQPGDYLYGDLRFRVTSPGEETGNFYYQAKGIFLLAYQTDTVTLADDPPTRRDLPALLRHRIRDTLQQTFPEDTEAFARALLLGDTSGLSYETDTDFKVSGIRHVVAVSGLHVSILFALLSMIAFRKRWLMALLGFPVLLLFAAVAGFAPSVSRSCLMSALLLLAMLVNREYDGPTALSFAVLVILLVNPLAVASVSFQLSVASVAGIYLFYTPICRWLTALFGVIQGRPLKGLFVRWFCGSISLSLSAMLLTTPLCAWYFGTVSLIGPLTNLLALWVISAVFYGITAVCLLYPAVPSLASFLARLVSLPIRYVLFIAEAMADVPMAAVYTQNVYIVIWLVLVYGMLLYFLLSSNRRPGLLGCCALLGLCLVQLAGMAEPMMSPMCFTVLDVGQGQCLLFQTEGKTYMVDCGGDSDTHTADLAAQTLLSQGITKLDGLILTHMDRDHAGAAAYLLSRIDTDLLIHPNTASDLAKHTSGTLICASQPLLLALEETKIYIYPPTFPGNSNEMSLCILFDTKNCDILVTSDRNGFGERSLLRNYPIPDVDVLIAGHHGSKNSTCEELLNAVRPELVCISAGEGNVYGHPAPELLRRLQAYGCTVYRTDQHGTITIRR